MLGKRKRCEAKLFYHGISLEERVPEGHRLRVIKQVVDFVFVREEVASLYGRKGHESLDPAVILKLMFLLFYEDVPSERQLLEQLPLRLDWLWFCDYDLDEATPHHSVLSKARRRWGQAVFERFFLRILEQCVSAGLVDGRTVHVDSCMIDGNVDIEKARPQLRLMGRRTARKLDDAEGESGSDEGDAGDDDSGDPPGTRINPVDPDARIGCKPGETVSGYKAHRAVDDRFGVVTATITTAANVHDGKVLARAVEAHEEGTSQEAEMVVADKIYGTAENYAHLRGQGKRCCIPHQRHGVKDDPAVSHDRFVYDPQRDGYVCPEGKVLPRYDHRGPHSGGIRYRAARETCQACRRFQACVASAKHGRQISRSVHVDVMAWADHCCSREQRKHLQGRRRSKAEGAFADAANNHSFKRARWRGLHNVTIQNLIIAGVQNLRKLLRYGFHKKVVSGCVALRPLFFTRFPPRVTAAWHVSPPRRRTRPFMTDLLAQLRVISSSRPLLHHHPVPAL